MLRIGHVVGGRYRLDQHLGDGGSGAVWAATHLLTREPVALKFLRKPGEEQSRRFLREGRIATSLRHPNIVAVRDLFELESASLVMVMDLVHGETLSARLRRGRLSNEETARVGAAIARALSAAHAQGVVHRDLKPGNVVLSGTPPGEEHVQILDFGIAKVLPVAEALEDTASSTETGALLGTPHYMAPEQVFGERDVDASADVWSLGVVLYECLAGVRPFEGDNYGQIFKSVTTQTPAPLASIRPDCSRSLAALVGRMLDRDRATRPLSHEIEAALSTNDPAPASEAEAPASDEDEAPRVPPKSRRVARAFGSVAIVVAALGAGSLVWTRPEQAETAPRPVDVPARLETQSAATTPTPASSASVGPAIAAAPTAVGAASATPHTPRPRASASAQKLPGGVHGGSPY